MSRRLVKLCVWWALVAGCSHGVRRYPLAEPLWEDPDRNHVPEMPADYYSGINGDGVDKLFLYPLMDLWAFDLPGEATNVNALDEVPNSTWFTNRIGLFDISPERAARASCGDTPSLDPGGGTWLITGAKPNGANPGFFIKGPDNQRYLLKFDSPIQPTRATGADVIGSKIWWTAGFFAPCNEIVYFRPEILAMDPEGTSEDIFGDKTQLTQEDVDKVLKMAFRTKDGRLRASASRFVPGKPLGPYRYQWTRGDDPNDIIPHEDRRELRATHLLAAWVNHVDAREQNTFDVVVEEGERRYIRHYKIDWGDALGVDYAVDAMTRRFGYSYAFDFEHIMVDLFSLGLVPRPWYEVERTEVEIFGYFGHEHFVPSEWRGVYQLPAFARRTHRDILWMVRILSRFTDAHVRAIVEAAKLPDPRQSEWLIDTLIKRRDAFFHEYLSQYTPLARFRLVRRTAGSLEQSLCFEDLAIKHGVVDPDTSYYKMRFFGGDEVEDELGWLQFTPDPDHAEWSCVVLPIGHRRPADLAPKDAPDDHPLRYGLLRIFNHQGASIPPTSSIELHFYDLGSERGYRLVGVDRPPKPLLPDLY